MSGEIYFFSGTGNTLTVARGLATQTDARLITIPSTVNQKSISPDTDFIGIVFPVYHGGLPLIVHNFIKKLTLSEKTYVFAACTYGDNPGLSLEHLARQVELRGGRLSGGFGVHMPYNYITPTFNANNFLGSFKLRRIEAEVQQILISESYTKIQTIAAYVNSRQTGKLERDSVVITRLVEAINLHETLGKSIWLKIAGVNDATDLPFIESRQLMDRAFHVDESCKGCGTCVKVCPVNNIALIEKRPVWQQHCEQCFACLQWCPQQAVQFGNNTTGNQRYHNPIVGLNEMLDSCI
jgi:ferredoxin/flavodoxin